ncbi:unnamed protein product [Rotaria socialis]|uniref:Peptidase M13 N-terminal domain-containing protein n=2 Tax=Rotaria socialis TaxID=392032 RepID=A0A820S9N1_9BILA|nr:unnamed protein product [Rotaria socialis]
MPDCCLWLNRLRCCRRRQQQQQQQQTYIYLYSPTMADSSSSSSTRSSSFLLNRLACILFAFCLAIILLLTALVIYHLNNNIFTMSPNVNSHSNIIAIAKKRQLQDFVNLDVDPCENFYNFVCDKWIQQRKSKDNGDYEKKRSRIRHKIHGKLMINISNNQIISSEGNISSSQLSILKFYQLCETQPASQLVDELERYFARLSQQEPYRSHLTLFNQTNLTHFISLPIIFQYNPFFKIIHSSSNNKKESFSTIIRTDQRSLPSPAAIFHSAIRLNQTALENLIKFDHKYTKILQQTDHSIKFYEQEYSQDSLIIKRILTFKNYHQCLPSLNMTNGLKNLIGLLNHFLQNRLRQFNTKLIDKQIRILETITGNHTLVEHLRRIQLEFKIIQQIIPLENHSIDDDNSTCILNLFEKLLDKRMQLSELPSTIDVYFHNAKQEYFISNDWPYLIMLSDRLLKIVPTDTLVNFVFFDYYRHFVYPYYQPHVHPSINSRTNYTNKSYTYIYETDDSNLSCYVGDCFDILNCYHPSLINQLMDDKNQIVLDSTRKSVENLINRFRLLIEHSDHLFTEEKKKLIKELNQIKIVLGHYSTPVQSIPNQNLSSYLGYVELFSSMSYDQHEHSYAMEPIYNSMNHTLFLPYGFIYLSNHSIEYSLMKILLTILSKPTQSNPFHIECLIKSFDDSNTTMIDIDDEHTIYLLYRSKFLFEQNINLDEYLWPFMSANSLMKRFLIDYTANNYCHSLHSYTLFRNNTYLMDDVYLVFHCPQASSIEQLKCSVH